MKSMGNEREEKDCEPRVPVRRIRASFNYDRDTVSRSTGLRDFGPSRTIQAHAQETDINFILEQFGVTGTLPYARFPPSYGDFSGVSDYQTAMEVLLEAQSAFMALPSAIRAQFDNDPASFVDFAENPANLSKLQEWGLAPATPPAPRQAGDENPPTPPKDHSQIPGGKPAA